MSFLTVRSINTTCIADETIQLTGYEKNKLGAVWKYLNTVFIHSILKPQVHVKDITIEVTERSRERKVAHITSIIPQREYVGIIIKSLVSAADIATSLFEIYSPKSGLLNISTTPPVEIPITATKSTE